jgi:hypothetical protein
MGGRNLRPRPQALKTRFLPPFTRIQNQDLARSGATRSDKEHSQRDRNDAADDGTHDLLAQPSPVRVVERLRDPPPLGEPDPERGSQIFDVMTTTAFPAPIRASGSARW